LKRRAENGADFPDLVDIAGGDEQRRHARKIAKIRGQASLTQNFFVGKIGA
jgi:hypothetical protein